MKKRVLDNRELVALERLVKWARDQELPKYEVPAAVRTLERFLGIAPLFQVSE